MMLTQRRQRPLHQNAEHYVSTSRPGRDRPEHLSLLAYASFLTCFSLFSPLFLLLCRPFHSAIHIFSISYNLPNYTIINPFP